MSDQDEPTQKLRIYPRPRRIVRRHLPVALAEPFELPPMPALEELARPDRCPPFLPGDARDDIARHPTLPLARTAARPGNVRLFLLYHVAMLSVIVFSLARYVRAAVVARFAPTQSDQVQVRRGAGARGKLRPRKLLFRFPRLPAPFPAWKAEGVPSAPPGLSSRAKRAEGGMASTFTPHNGGEWPSWHVHAKGRRRSVERKKKPAPRPRLRRRRRPRCITLALLLLLALVVLGGLAVSGLYTLETTVLAPLAQFFHPLGGDSDGAIDGRAWNLLLLGSDNDQKFVFPAVLTQVMMVVHVDPLNKRVFMLSIPRDSWVAVPGQGGMHKIDQAFYMGAATHHSFDDGVRLARATIEQDYGISIDRYAWIGLEGFASVIDTVGGIDIDVTHPLLDDNYPDDTGGGVHASNPYALKRLFLVPGPQYLSGEQALEYVRSRHADLVGDIGRTQRQQEVLEALKKKLDASTIFNHLSALFHDLTGKVYTDLSEPEMLSVANFARDLPADAIQRLTLGPGRGNRNYGSLATINDPGLDASQDIILPDCAHIQPVINQIFDLGDVQSCRVDGGG